MRRFRSMALPSELLDFMLGKFSDFGEMVAKMDSITLTTTVLFVERLRFDVVASTGRSFFALFALQFGPKALLQEQ